MRKVSTVDNIMLFCNIYNATDTCIIRTCNYLAINLLLWLWPTSKTYTHNFANLNITVDFRLWLTLSRGTTLIHYILNIRWTWFHMLLLTCEIRFILYLVYNVPILFPWKRVNQGLKSTVIFTNLTYIAPQRIEGRMHRLVITFSDKGM